ncbi:MAG: VWA domain-containing protein [Betaproteobacteria bacterium]
MIEWLRPEWFLALPAALALGWAWWRARSGAGPWRRVVDPELLAALAGRAPGAGNWLAPGLAAAVLVLAGAALAGPTWRTQPVALHRDAGARIVVLDLSPSMDAVDLAPTRLARARTAAADLLRDAAGAQLGLVVFAADAFSIAPLSADPAVLVHLLAGATTGVVPRAGSRPDLGLDLARKLLAESGAAAGEVILVGDSAGDARALAAARALEGAGFALSVLAVGTPHGGPVRVAERAFARTEAGEVFVARPEFGALERVAQAGGGRFQLLPAAGPTPRFARGARPSRAMRADVDNAASTRQDDGALLALLALPFAALLFRRGWLAGVAVLAFGLSSPQPALALDWPDLWRRADQQAAQAFAKGDPGDAARLLEKLDPGSPWRAMLYYRAGRYAEAEAQFAALDTAAAHYNRGNALALAGQLEQALQAYDAALARRPRMGDALHNRALVREALKKQRAQGTGGELTGSQGSARPQSRGPGAPGRPDLNAPAREEPGRPDPAQARAQPREESSAARETPERAELRRLEEMLSKLPDDSGSLLANRFAHQLRQRGKPHPDTGARW